MSATKQHGLERLSARGIAPRSLPAVEAAAYCGLSTGFFLSEIEAGLLPKSLGFSGAVRLWDRRALDKAMDKMSGLADDVTVTVGEDPILAAINGVD